MRLGPHAAVRWSSREPRRRHAQRPRHHRLRRRLSRFQAAQDARRHGRSPARGVRPDRPASHDHGPRFAGRQCLCVARWPSLRNEGTACPCQRPRRGGVGNRTGRRPACRSPRPQGSARDRDVATLVASRVAPSASLSPSQMMQADTIGIGIAARAGFDPYGAWRLLESMRRRQELRSAALSSAPPLQFSGRWPAALPDRVRNALESARTVADGGARHRDTTIGGRDPRSPPRPAGSRCGHPPLPSQVRDRRLYPGTSWPVFRLKRTRRRRQAAAPIGAQGMRSPTGRVATMQLGASGRAVAVASPP